MHELLVVSRIVVIVLASTVAYLSFRGHRRNRSNALLLLGFGFLFFVVGAIVEGVLYEFFDVAIHNVFAVGSVLEALGFVVIIYSIYGTRS